MDIDSLRYFAGVAKTGSITKAAKHLFLSQQGLNKAIGAMEAELGFALVERTRTGTTLTSDGEAFLLFCEQTIAAFDRTIAGMAQRQLETHDAPSIALGATAYALRTVFDNLANNRLFAKLRIQELAPSDIASRLEQADDDIRLYVTDLFEGSSLAKRILSSNRFHPIFQTEFGLVVPESSVTVAARMTTADLMDVEFACFHDESIDWILEKTYGTNPPRNIMLKTSDSAQLIRWAESRKTAILLDSFAFHRLKASRGREAFEARFVPIDGMPRVTTGFLHRRGAEPSDDAQTFMRSLRALFRARYADYSRAHPV